MSEERSDERIDAEPAPKDVRAATAAAAELGVYVHFPWCRKRCPYCDFAIAVAEPGQDIPHRAYADAVLVELAARAPRFAGRRLVSIYFGGGTPALWDPAEIGRVRAEIARTFAGQPEEITVEANPNDCTPDRLAALYAAGVNRLSIGAQSFSDGELVFLGRDHDARASLAALAAARAAGFDNVSLDLICALPGRSLDDWRATLERTLALAPEHVSIYALTIEERTPFGAAARAGRLTPAPEEDAADQLTLADERLRAAGYDHYEVSAFARPGRRAVHNSLYWRAAEYLGLGNGAHSFWRDGDARGERWSSHRAVSRYLAENPNAVAESLPQDAAALREDRIWTGMRTSDGVPRSLFPRDPPALARLVETGLVEAGPDRLRPTPKGLLFADEIGATLLE